jgi:hypothetical protein
MEELCGTQLYACICELPAGHEGGHICNPYICGGSWEDSVDGMPENILAYPGGYNPAVALITLFGMVSE